MPEFICHCQTSLSNDISTLLANWDGGESATLWKSISNYTRKISWEQRQLNWCYSWNSCCTLRKCCERPLKCDFSQDCFPICPRRWWSKRAVSIKTESWSFHFFANCRLRDEIKKEKLLHFHHGKSLDKFIKCSMTTNSCSGWKQESSQMPVHFAVARQYNNEDIQRCHYQHRSDTTIDCL